MKAAPGKSCPSCGERYDADVLFCPRDGTPLASSRSPSFGSAERDPYLGVELPGQIRLDHLVGIGSMGRVYRAFQGGIERHVAVKVLHRELSGNTELVARFHREAKVASRLVHPNVVQVLMTGNIPPSSDPRAGGELYLVMEYLDGISLLSALAAAGTGGEGAALPLPRALHVALQICDAVGEAHAQGIVHRDLKPENVMLVRRGEDHDYVKVLDFGIARLDWIERSMATQAGLIFGTAKYISPEGAEGHPVGPPADVYSIATMLYQMLAGRTPFEGDSPVALLVQHTHAPPPELRSITRASYVPPPLAAVIMQNLVKKPGDRAPNARELGRELAVAARASGLFPEEIASQALFSPSSLGAVKLASKERTKSHELSAELAARIGGVAAAPPVIAPARAPETEVPVTLPSHLPATTVPMDALPAALVPVLQQHAPAPAAATVTPMPASAAAPAARRSAPASSRPAASARTPDLDFGEEASVNQASATVPSGPAYAAVSTMQGTETTLSDAPPPAAPSSSSSTIRARKARLTRLALAVAGVLLIVPAAVVGGRRLGAFGASAEGSLDATLEEARDCMRRRAWDAPPGHNFKEITDQATLRWPDSARVQDLRREGAERLVSDALGRKYAGDLPEALRLVNLALQLDPKLTTAQHLAAELEGPRAPEVAPAGSASASAPGGKSRRGGRDAKTAEPRPTAPDPGSPSRPPPTPPPSATPSAKPTGAVLPQTPPPPPPQPNDKRPPAPPSTGPWL